MPASRLVLLSSLALAIAAASPSVALDYLNNTVQPDRAVPAACLSFSSELPRGKTELLKPFVAIDPALDHSLEAKGKDLCIGGLKHGAHYTVRVKAGLPAADGTALPKDVTVELQIPDRQRQVFFDKGKTLLPMEAGVGLPLKSVNVATAHLVLYRFTERTMADHVGADWFGNVFDSYGLQQIEDRSTKVFEGSLDIAQKRNEQVSTTIPIAELVKTLVPGVYVIVATSGTDRLDRDDEHATQWFSVSDIGLATVKTDAGMLVMARSLASAAPAAGVDVQLLSRANEILGRWTTDASGRISIAPGLLRGEHGDAPRILAASDQAGGFSWLQLDTPSLDLSDLDVKGRAPPAGNDAFLWTDRGVYKPGETIHLGALLRDRAARPVPGLPLTLHLVRPDGIEIGTRPLPLPSAGGGTLDIPMAENAFSGSWRFWVSAGDKAELGSISVSVQDFVPPRLEAKATLSPATHAGADATIPVDVAADYFYGSPGAALTGQVEGTLKAAETPFKELAGFHFGLAQEPFLPKALPAADFTTDDKGRAHVELKPETIPDTTVPLAIEARATINDVDGRPAVAEASETLHTADRFIGLRPDFSDLSDGATARFTVALVDGDGHPLGQQSLKWDLVKETYTYSYFSRGGRWQFKETVTDARVTGGEVVLGADGRGSVSAQVGDGRWRLEAYDASGKVATSVRFGAGWWAASEEENRKPEVMKVEIDQHPPAGRVRAMIEPSFAGRALVMLDGNGLHGVQEVTVPKGGGAVEFDAADVPAAGAYVVAMAVSPSGAVVPRLPVRAVGLAWVPGDRATHTLDVSLAAPDTIKPKTTLAVDVAATGEEAGKDVYVTLAAVDEAVLRMTNFASPDPADHYLGRREPGLELRDVYNQIIDPVGAPGRLKEGGDGNANANAAGLDVKTFKTVALFKGPVRLDASGHARISVDVPDFSGCVRLMAVAWSGERYGHAEKPVTVRPALLAELTLPRFLAPGDKVRARVMLTDLEAPEQTYAVTLTTKGAVGIDKQDALFEDVKRDKRRYVDRTLTARAVPGVGRIHMVARGDDGTTEERDFEISVRTPNAYVSHRQIVTLAPGATLSLDDALAQGLVPGTSRLDVTASTGPAIDAAPLLAELRRYPYGCAEQTISRAFPELFAKRLGAKLPVPVADTVTAQGAIQRLASLQAEDGSFGYWTSFDVGNFWLTSYAVDFMQHARTEGFAVPDAMESRATAWLAQHFSTVDLKPDEVAGSTYAAIVLSRAGKLDLSQLDYIANRVRGSLPSDVARMQLAAALSRVGERDLTRAVLAAAPVTRDPRVWLNDYGSQLRDDAMTLALMAEEKLLPRKALYERADALSRELSNRFYLSTQEEAWVLRVAFDLHGTTPLNVTLDGKPNAVDTDSLRQVVPLAAGRTSTLVNKGAEPIFAALTTTGIPGGAQPAEQEGFSIGRVYYHLDGTPADLADLHQNDELVVVVSGAMTEPARRKVLMVDMLPAGLEPETVGLATSRDEGQFAWLKDLTAPTFFQLRDDRYMAGLDLDTGSAAFKVAYVVRAVSPGSFANPGSQIEDMYAPSYHARDDAGTLVVQPARKPQAMNVPVKPAPASDDTKTTAPKGPNIKILKVRPGPIPQ